MQEGLSPEVAGEFKSALDQIETQLGIVRDEGDEFRKKHILDLQTIPAKASKDEVENLDKRTDDKLALIKRDITIINKKLAKLRNYKSESMERMSADSPKASEKH